jgi:DNA topoisomerase-1
MTRTVTNETRGGAYKAKDITPLWKKRCEHSGVRFPKEYAALGLVLERITDPTSKVHLSPQAEQFGLTYARLSVVAKDPRATSDTFRENFSRDWHELALGPSSPPRERERNSRSDSLDDWDWEGLLERAEEARKREPTEKKNNKKHNIGENYGKSNSSSQGGSHATIDGKRYALKNDTVDREGVFLGRNVRHPLNGCIRRRLTARDVDLNMSRGARVPPVPSGSTEREWGGVVHDPKVGWLARWKDPLTAMMKYTQLDGGASLRQAHEERKFELARQLARDIDRVRARIEKDCGGQFRNDAMTSTTAMAATCASVVEVFGIRVGNEESSTTGAAYLRPNEVRILADRFVRLVFVGKDHVDYDMTRRMPPNAYACLVRYVTKRAKRGVSDRVFEGIGPRDVNAYLDGLVPGLTCKVIRTFKASSIVDGRLLGKKNNRSAFRTESPKRLVELCFYEVAWHLNHKTLTKRKDELSQEQENEQAQRFDVLCETFWNGSSSWSSAELISRAKELRLAPGTSKANYVDPRIIAVFCRKYSTDALCGVYGASLRRRFDWAVTALSAFRF